MTRLVTRRSLLASVLATTSTVQVCARSMRHPKDCLVRITTAVGVIKVLVNAEQAPVSADNFLEYVDRNLFHGAQFYRAVHPDNDANPVKISVLQGGIVEVAKQLPPISHETTLQTGLRHVDGTVSIARAAPGTGSAAAFFICIGSQPELDFGGRRNPDGQGFAAFGSVVAGMDIVRAIWMRPTTGTDGAIASQMIANPVEIRSVRRAV
jgi:peptidyl-prolyl cis-trans isomerase A (cyclophilin A)